jgi:prepilin-type N-terminal cleavage/methylation domain-containing protein
MREIFQKKNYQNGMTLIEMLMVVFIFMTISTMILFNYGKFESSISLQNLADDIALSIREAQSYAIGARGIPNNSTDESFFKSYGIFFRDTGNASNAFVGGSPKSFVFFVDEDMNKHYDYDKNNNSPSCGENIINNNECYKVISISSADYISDIATTPINNSIKGVNVIFTRPYPEPSFCLIGDSEDNCLQGSSTTESIEIEVKNPRTGKIKTVTITNTGQIVVK